MLSLNHLDVKIGTFDAEIDVANGLAIVVYDLEVVKTLLWAKVTGFVGVGTLKAYTASTGGVYRLGGEGFTNSDDVVNEVLWFDGEIISMCNLHD